MKIAQVLGCYQQTNIYHKLNIYSLNFSCLVEDYHKLNITPLKTSIKIKLNKYHHCNSLNYENEDDKPHCPAGLVDDLSCEHEFGFEATIKNVESRWK